MVDALDSKSSGPCGRASSILPSGTTAGKGHSFEVPFSIRNPQRKKRVPKERYACRRSRFFCGEGKSLKFRRNALQTKSLSNEALLQQLYLRIATRPPQLAPRTPRPATRNSLLYAYSISDVRIPTSALRIPTSDFNLLISARLRRACAKLGFIRSARAKS